MTLDESLHAIAAHYRAMPPVAAMEVGIAGYDGETLRLHAPLARHVNDKGCAFGGSLVSLMTLAAWGLVTLRLERAGIAAEVFVADTEVRYLAPLFADLEAEARLAEDASWDAFEATLRERGRAPAVLACCVRLAGGGMAAEARARYVAIAKGYARRVRMAPPPTPEAKTMRGQRTNLRPWLVACLLALLLAACATGGGKANALQQAQYAYSAAIRWGDFEGAWNMLEPEYRQANPMTDVQLERYKHIQVSAYRDVGAQAGDDSAAREIQIGVINRHTMAERSLRYSERWRYDAQAKSWWVTGGMPDFWAGE